MSTAPPGSVEITTPSASGVARRAGLWVAIALVFVLVVVVVVALPRQEAAPGYLSIESTASNGARAVVEVLRDQGVDVRGTASLAETRDAIDDPGRTTVVLHDRDLILTEEQRTELLGLAGTLVVLEPDDLSLAELAPGVVAGPAILSPTRDDCDLPAVDRAEAVDAVGPGYRIDDAATGTVGCLAGPREQYGLVRTTTDGTTVSVLGLTSAITNGEILREGNAALVLNLLGENERLVWYVPGYADLEQEDVATLADLTPPWVTWLVVLAMLTAVAGMVWRGRRFGPLAIENLPVVVRANETMEGRARLYERARARLHAVDALRIGAIGRLATRCGVARTAPVTEVVDAVARVTGRPAAEVAGVLVDAIPDDDASVVRLSDALLRLEAEVEHALRTR